MVKCWANINVASRYRYLQMIYCITNIGFRDIKLSRGKYLGIDSRLSVLPRFACNMCSADIFISIMTYNDIVLIYEFLVSVSANIYTVGISQKFRIGNTCNTLLLCRYLKLGNPRQQYYL